MTEATIVDARCRDSRARDEAQIGQGAERTALTASRRDVRPAPPAATARDYRPRGEGWPFPLEAILGKLRTLALGVEEERGGRRSLDPGSSFSRVLHLAAGRGSTSLPPERGVHRLRDLCVTRYEGAPDEGNHSKGRHPDRGTRHRRSSSFACVEPPTPACDRRALGHRLRCWPLRRRLDSSSFRSPQVAPLPSRAGRLAEPSFHARREAGVRRRRAS